MDDCASTRHLLERILKADARIEVVGSAFDGQSALDQVARNKPGVVVMDSHMPRMDGFEATRLIMEKHPVPVVIVSTTAPDEVESAFRIMEAGAVACVPKPVEPGQPGFETSAKRLVQKVRLMSEVKVVRRWPRDRMTPRAPNAGHLAPVMPRSARSGLIVGIGASTGGPPVLQQILAALPRDFPAAILIVQHISPGFLPGLVEWLNRSSSLQIQIASHGIQPQAGRVYVAPDGFNFGVGTDGRIVLSGDGNDDEGLRPSVAHLFRSLAANCGRRAIGVLLTGMGKDGAAEMKLMQKAGAITLAQDRETSVVHGMPGAAISLGAASRILPADRIAATLVAIADGRTASGGESR